MKFISKLLSLDDTNDPPQAILTIHDITISLDYCSHTESFVNNNTHHVNNVNNDDIPKDMSIQKQSKYIYINTLNRHM